MLNGLYGFILCLLWCLCNAAERANEQARERAKRRAAEREQAQIQRETQWRAQHPRSMDTLNAQHRASAQQRLQLAETLRQVSR